MIGETNKSSTTCRTTRFWLAVVAVVTLSSLSSTGNAFQILSALTQPCHENMTLAALGFGATEYRSTPNADSLLSRFVAKVNETGIPNDDGTRAIMREMTARFHWDGLDESTRYVLTSLVAGARMPDTHGFSVIDIDHIRDNHLTDSAQATHMLRKRENDGPDGNVSAIAQTRTQITSLLNGILASWNAGAWTTTQTWAFAFYGEHPVQLFSAAFNLGQVAHSIEDSYSHAIRDDQFNILAVANYIEAMSEDHDEARDGPPHSDRLDQCNMNDTFDNMRVTEARRQVVLVFNQMDSLLSTNAADDASVEAILNTTFVYKSGCGFDVNYCNTPWIEKSREQISEPYKLGFNCGLMKRADNDGPSSQGPGNAILAIVAIGTLFGVTTALRKRQRSR